MKKQLLGNELSSANFFSIYGLVYSKRVSQPPFQQPAAHDRFTHGRMMILEKKTRGGGIINPRLNKLSVKNKLNVREYKKTYSG